MPIFRLFLCGVRARACTRVVVIKLGCCVQRGIWDQNCQCLLHVTRPRISTAFCHQATGMRSSSLPKARAMA